MCGNPHPRDLVTREQGKRLIYLESPYWERRILTLGGSLPCVWANRHWMISVWSKSRNEMTGLIYGAATWSVPPFWIIIFLGWAPIVDFHQFLLKRSRPGKKALLGNCSHRWSINYLSLWSSMWSLLCVQRGDSRSLHSGECILDYISRLGWTGAATRLYEVFFARGIPGFSDVSGEEKALFVFEFEAQPFGRMEQIRCYTLFFR